MRDGIRRYIPVLDWAPRLTRGAVRRDVVAGLTGAAIVLPQGVAFAAVAGMPPEYGLYTALVAPIVAALLGSSRVMVTGPNTPLAIVILTTVSPLALPGSAAYVGLVLMLTVMVGAIQILAAGARLGALVAFVSPSVMTGFTAAAACVIFLGQLGPAVGLPEHGESVLRRFLSLLSGIGRIDPAAISVAVLTVAVVLLVQRRAPRLPAFLIGLVAGSLAAEALVRGGVSVAVVGALPSALPSFVLPPFGLETFSDLAQGAAALALVAILQAVSIGRTLALRRRERFDSTQEIFAQGVANLVGGFFQNFASSGSFTRSAVNAEAGAESPLSAISASLFLGLILLLLLPLIAHVPVPAIAGLILLVAWRLIDRAEIRHILASSRSETAVLAVTFGTGLLVSLDFAVFLGVIASLMVFLHRTSQPVLSRVSPRLVNGVRKFVPEEPGAEGAGRDCPQIGVMRLDGTLYFGAVEGVERAFRRFEVSARGQGVKVLVLKGLGTIDLAGADLLIDEIRAARRAGGEIQVVATEPLRTRLDRLGVTEELGPALHSGKAEAIAAAVAAADGEICRTCRLRIFHECAGKPGARAAMRELGF